jgi:hypothetical protein
VIEYVGPLLREWFTTSEAALASLLTQVPAPPGDWGPLTVEVFDEANTGWLALREAPQGLTTDTAAVCIFQLDDFALDAFGKVGPTGAHHEFVLPIAIAVLVHEAVARRGRGQVSRIQRAILDSLASLFQPDQAASRRAGHLALGRPSVSCLAEPGRMEHAILASLVRLDLPIVAAASVLRPA